MKKLVIYSSVSGNTQKIAEAIAKTLSCKAVRYSSEMAKRWREFDFIAVGFYLDKGAPDECMAEFLREICGKRLGVFITMGGDPSSEYGLGALQNAAQELEKNGNEVVVKFSSQGAISPIIIENLRKMASSDAKYQITAQKEQNWAKAATHPDEEDILNAKKAFSFLA